MHFEVRINYNRERKVTGLQANQEIPPFVSVEILSLNHFGRFTISEVCVIRFRPLFVTGVAFPIFPKSPLSPTFFAYTPLGTSCFCLSKSSMIGNNCFGYSEPLYFLFYVECVTNNFIEYFCIGPVSLDCIQVPLDLLAEMNCNRRMFYLISYV